MIKKLVFTAILSIGLLTSSYAQQPFQRELSFGGSFGVGFPTVDFAPKVKQNMSMTYNGGFTTRWISDKNVGIQVEVNLSQQGWDEEYEDPQYHYTRTINYIEVPFLTHIYAGNRRVRFVFNLGPKIGYALGESTSENLNGGAYPPNENRTAQHDLAIEKKFDWGLCGGPGLEVRTGIGSFIVEGRYYYALGGIYNTRKDDSFAKASNQLISVKLTYLTHIFSRR